MIKFEYTELIYFQDLESCPYVPKNLEYANWIKRDDERLKLIALDRYLTLLNKRKNR